jgi:predicted TPR repeat methyltransferase
MIYDEDYYERGVETGKSLYSNFRWMPELTIPLAHEIIKALGLKEGDSVLDFGCAKGYLVKALRLLKINASGFDISEYAISQVDSDVKQHVATTIPDKRFDFIICKDVLEHMSAHLVGETLKTLAKHTDRVFIVVPLGDGEKYIIPSYELDITHVIRESLSWWENEVSKAGFECVQARYECGYLKGNYKQYPNGNGFLVGTK